MSEKVNKDSYEYFEKPTWEQFRTLSMQKEQMFLDFINQPGYGIAKHLHAPLSKIFPNVFEEIIKSTPKEQIVHSGELLHHIQLHNVDLYSELESINPTLSYDQNAWNNLFNKTINGSVEEFIDRHYPKGLSSRKRSSFARVYPELHHKSVVPENNFKWHKALIALEVKNEKFIKRNIGYYLRYLKHDFMEMYPESFQYLEKDYYSDVDVLRHIDVADNIQYVKSEESAIKFFEYHNKTLELYTVESIEMLENLYKLDITPASISYNLINKYPEKVIEWFPNYYEIVVEELGDNEALKLPKQVHLNALKDPYNIIFLHSLGLISFETFNEFIINSNTELYESKLAMDFLKDNLHEYFFDQLVSDFVTTMSTDFSAVWSFPVLAFYLDGGSYMTPYIINHIVKIDNKTLDFM